jgi:hypothetical protein
MLECTHVGRERCVAVGDETNGNEGALRAEADDADAVVRAGRDDAADPGAVRVAEVQDAARTELAGDGRGVGVVVHRVEGRVHRGCEIGVSNLRRGVDDRHPYVGRPQTHGEQRVHLQLLEIPLPAVVRVVEVGAAVRTQRVGIGGEDVRVGGPPASRLDGVRRGEAPGVAAEAFAAGHQLGGHGRARSQHDDDGGQDLQDVGSGLGEEHDLEAVAGAEDEGTGGGRGGGHGEERGGDQWHWHGVREYMPRQWSPDPMNRDPAKEHP